MDSIDDVLVRYEQVFGRPAPVPWGVSDDRRAEVLLAALLEGRPVPEDFNWWTDRPPGAVA